jgi:cell volume regulation protein A
MLPRDALVSVIVRDDEALLPRGSSEVAGGDRLHILVRESARKQVEALFERWREGPIGEEEEMPLPTLRGRSPIFSVKPWSDDQGDPAEPGEVDGTPVRRVLRTRRELRGALVVLADGRLAVTGEGVVATGGPGQLLRYARDRIRRAQSEQALAWWQEVAGAVSLARARAGSRTNPPG